MQENTCLKITEKSYFSEDEIQELIRLKKLEFNGLITDEGALLLVAKELGVDVKEYQKFFDGLNTL